MRTETALIPNAIPVATVPTTSTGTSHDRWAPSTVTRTAGMASGSTPTRPSSPTVAAPTSMPAPARVTGGTASGRAVSAQYDALPTAATAAYASPTGSRRTWPATSSTSTRPPAASAAPASTVAGGRRRVRSQDRASSSSGAVYSTSSATATGSRSTAR